MVTLAVVALILLGLYLGTRWFANADPKSLIRTLKWIGGIAAAGVMVFLVLRGGAGMLAPLAIFFLPMVRRWLRAQMAGGWSVAGGARPSGAPRQSSAVETATLRMNLEHDTGRVGGDIKQGPFAGRTLDGLAFAEAVDLLTWCESHDAQSVGLVEAYLDRAHGADWRDRAEARAAPARPAGASMTRTEACEVLGVAPGASAAEIRAAYHRLMLKVHPDHGGSTFLAAKINQAKDLLLGG